MFQRILVTGSAGFIGSHLTDYLINRGHRVSGVDNLSGGFRRNINPRSSFKRLDLRNQKTTQMYIKKTKPDLIFHLAADATEGRSQFTPISSVENNMLAFVNVLTPAINEGVKKFILASSMSVYGKQQTPFTEDIEPKPEDVYGVCKAAMEQTLRIMAEVHGFNYAIIRPHNVYGERQNIADPYRNVIGIFVNRLLQNQPLLIYGNGEQVRSFTYIGDLIPYIYKVGLEDKFNGEIFNLGSDDPISVNQLAGLVLKKYFGGAEIPIHLRPVYLPFRPKEVAEAFCGHEKAVRLLGYSSCVTLEEGVERVIDWARKLGPKKSKFIALEIESDLAPLNWQKKGKKYAGH